MGGDKFAAALEDGDDKPQAVTAAAVFGGGALMPRRDVIKREADGSMTYKRAVMTSVGLVMPDDVTEDELIEIGTLLRGMESSIQWLLGDWLNRAERVWGQIYADVPEYSYQTLRDYAYVARSVELSIRNRQLSFMHHRLVAGLAADDQKAWLAYAEENKLSVAQMRNAMRPEPIKRDAVVAQVKKWAGEIAGIENRLKGMSAQQREQVRTRAEWLSDYYRKIAERAK